MIKVIDNPKQMPLKQLLWILDMLNKENRYLYYMTPQDVFGDLKPAVKYDRCVKMLTDLDAFWTRNEQECMFSIVSEERAKGVLLSVTIAVTNRKMEQINGKSEVLRPNTEG